MIKEAHKYLRPYNRGVHSYSLIIYSLIIGFELKVHDVELKYSNNYFKIPKIHYNFLVYTFFFCNDNQVTCRQKNSVNTKSDIENPTKMPSLPIM